MLAQCVYVSFCRCSSRICYHSSWRGEDQDHACKGIHTETHTHGAQHLFWQRLVNTPVRWCLAGGELSGPAAWANFTTVSTRNRTGRGSTGTVVTYTHTHIYHLIWTVDSVGKKCLCAWLMLEWGLVAAPEEFPSQGSLSLGGEPEGQRPSCPLSVLVVSPPLPPSFHVLFHFRLALTVCLASLAMFCVCVKGSEFRAPPQTDTCTHIHNVLGEDTVFQSPS